MTHQAPTQPPQEGAGSAHLLYSEQEEDLRAAVRALLADRCPPETVLAHAEGGRAYDTALWQALGAEMGTAGLLVPEQLGGAGGSAREAAVVLEELGRAVSPVPYLTSAVIATQALLSCVGAMADANTDSGEQPRAAAETAADAEVAVELLAALASGERVGVLAVPLSSAPGSASAVTVRADAHAALTGQIAGVADALAADVLLVPADGPDGVGLYAVETSAPKAARLRLDPSTPLDLTRTLARISLDAMSARRVAGPGGAEAAIARALLTGAGLLASEQLGLAEWCLTQTVRYTKERHQFGRPVGSFQALKHRMAALWLDLVSARAAARAAADALATGDRDAPVAVAVAQAHTARVAVRAAQECVQLHGGIGMTWEHPAHLYLKRAKSDEIALGTPGRHQEVLARLIDLPAPTG
ncbi:acyl-CoA dehydrogenase family protein [Streptomyces zagrosensis]|uniref:Alkylation response protein AidB-like acyl-CoA dehydrogenase n=1 Tax=Streptomyces zagrosensis TaxID=1042984 RepID=A0A7W9V063_9ACTN|nr:acyl-CoA dehydrogenase family protein [Streptomyces zagrosensis]MBB5937803.1 alkylation response protein AidB-like acyl-CoA dehydrogenase [Streptomyces zagrosensis]